MEKNMLISEKKLEKLAKKIAKAFAISKEEAFEIIYEEWEVIEALYDRHKKTKAVAEHLIIEINLMYCIG